MTKRYLLFAFAYEAMGGFNDLQGEFDTLEEAKAAIYKIDQFSGLDDGHIADMQQRRIVCYFGRRSDPSSGKYTAMKPWHISDADDQLSECKT
jgi:hypothetical protein